MRIGTCSWKYESWRGLVYPEFGEINYLEEYSKVYNTVEVDQWFWSLHKDKAILPMRSVVEEYDSVTPENFKFTIKAPNSLTLTNYYKSEKKNPYFLSADLMEAFIKNLEPIHNKIGVIMLQFEYLNKQKMSSLDEFLKLLDSFLSDFSSVSQLGIEIRNPNYLDKRYFEFLYEKSITPILLQGYYMPSITDIYGKFNKWINKQVVIRLHGYDREGIEERTKKVWNKIVEPKDTELGEILKLIQDLQSKKVDIYLNVNNHYEGSAPVTISKIEESLS